MIEDPTEDTIRAYLIGKLSEPERLTFEARLEHDATLVEKVNLLTAEMAAAEWMIAEENRALFAQWKQEKSSKKRNLINGKNFGLGALVLCLVFIAAVVWYQQQKQISAPETLPETPVLPQAKQEKNPVAPDNRKVEKPARQPAKPNYIALAKQHFQEPVLPTVRSTQTDTTKTPLLLAREAYAAGNYAQTVVLLEQVDSTRRQSADFLLANALFQLQKYREAEKTFEKIVTSGSKQYRYPSEWNMLVCKLAQLPARKTDFEKQLEDIQKRPDHPYFQQAKNLQKDLNK